MLAFINDGVTQLGYWDARFVLRKALDSIVATYVILCEGSVASLQRVSLGPIERYGEVLSGAFIALIGVALWLGPLL